jgi:O-antigen ligase
MGSWLVMATPLVIGYMVRRLHRRGGGRRAWANLDATTLWFGGAAAAMFAASILSLSRSTFLGMLAAVLCGGLIVVAHRGRDSVVWLAGIVAVSAFIAAALPGTADLVSRFENSGSEAKWSRIQIWHDTLPMVRDFPLTGVGLGAYRTAMVVYQQADRELAFNQAHNQYLQLVAEGGLLLAMPLVLACAAFAATVLRRMREDRSHTFWLRAGAVAGVAGIAVQSLFETGLRMPANALLFATLCAVAVYDAHPDRGVDVLGPQEHGGVGTKKRGWVGPSPSSPSGS